MPPQSSGSRLCSGHAGPDSPCGAGLGAPSRRCSRNAPARLARALAQALLALAVLAACEGAAPGEVAPAGAPIAELEPGASEGREPIAPLPREPIAVDRAHADLGRALWFDPILSGGDPGDPLSHGEVTCETCHQLERAGTDGLDHSAAPGRPHSGVNVPSVFNLAHVFRFSWSGRFDDMDDILHVAMTSPAAMATRWEDAVARLQASSPHRDAFARTFTEGVTIDTLRAALRAFVLTLTTPDAPFDRWLRGDRSAIDAEAIEGYRLFREYGCSSCHQGVNVGGNMYQRFGVMRDYFADRGDVRPADLGLFEGTQREEHRHVFRVPSLRNVALTAPYFHDGTADTLEEAVATMARYQLGRPLAPEHLAHIVAFLRTLTGRLDAWDHLSTPGAAEAAWYDRGPP